MPWKKKTQELHGHKFGSPSPFQIPVMLVEIHNSDMCRTYLPDISEIYRTSWFHPHFGALNPPPFLKKSTRVPTSGT